MNEINDYEVKLNRLKQDVDKLLVKALKDLGYRNIYYFYSYLIDKIDNDDNFDILDYLL